MEMRSVIRADSSIKISSREDTAGEARTMVRSGRERGTMATLTTIRLRDTLTQGYGGLSPHS